MRILVDMDGVLADFESGFVRDWRTRFPDAGYVPVAQRTAFYVRDDYPDDQHQNVYSIMVTPGFFRYLPPISGAVQALRALRVEGHDVFICTSPLADFEHCVVEKYAWVESHLGREWTHRIILTRDKTLVMGDILIDDRPTVTGEMAPVWEHVLYDQPYNRNVQNLRRLTWDNWRTILFGK